MPMGKLVWEKTLDVESVEANLAPLARTYARYFSLSSKRLSLTESQIKATQANAKATLLMSYLGQNSYFRERWR